MDDEGQAKSAQACQAIGTLLVTKSKEVSEDEAKRALDYFRTGQHLIKSFNLASGCEGRIKTNG